MSSNGGSNYRWVMRAYPADYRQAVGDELVDTANALSGNRWSLRQSAGLLTGGLRTRERLASNGDWRMAAASGFGIALLLGHLSVALAAALFLGGLRASDGVLVSDQQALVAAFAATSALSVLLLVRSTARGTLATLAALQVGLLVATWIGGSLVGVTQVLSFATLWFIAKYGDGRAVLSAPLVAGLTALLVGVAFAASEPFAPIVLKPALILLGLGLIRLRPSVAFAAALTVAFNPFIVGSFSAENGGLLLIAGVVGYFAYRNVDREQPTAPL